MLIRSRSTSFSASRSIYIRSVSSSDSCCSRARRRLFWSFFAELSRGADGVGFPVVTVVDSRVRAVLVRARIRFPIFGRSRLRGVWIGRFTADVDLTRLRFVLRPHSISSSAILRRS
jgi:hypothetical protein